MKRLLIILMALVFAVDAASGGLLYRRRGGEAAPPSAPDYMTNVVIWLSTNAANSVTNWVNDGSHADDVWQFTTAKQPDSFGQAYSFGAGDFMTGTFTTVIAETNALTISLWFKVRALADECVFVSTFNGGASPGIQIYYDGGNRLGVGVRNPPNYNYKYSDVNSLNDTNWHHLAFRYANTLGPQLLGFFDAQPMTNILFGATNNSLAESLAFLAINGYANNASPAGNGRCDLEDLRFWTNPLSISDIGLIYTNGPNVRGP